MMNSFAISCLITAILTMILAIFVILKRGELNKLWFWTGVSIFLWTIGLFGSVVAENERIAYLSQRILYVGTILLIPTLTKYIFTLIDFRHKLRKVYLFFIYLFSVSFILLSFSRYFIIRITTRNSFGYWPVETGPIYVLFLIFFSLAFLMDLVLLYLAFVKSSGYKRKQFQYSFYAILIGLVGGSTNFLLDFNLNVYPIGNFFVSLYVIIMTYAILKYRLMDIRLVISKSILYFILIGLVALAFTSITFITGQLFTGEGFSNLLVTLFISLIIVFGLDPLKRFLARVTDKIFYKDKIDYQEVLKMLGIIIAKEIEFKKMFVDLSGALEKSIKCKNVNFLYKNKITGIFRGVSDENIFLSGNDEIINYILNNKEVIITEELDRRVSELDEKTRIKIVTIIDRLKKMKMGLIAPIVLNGEIISILSIEKKLSGDAFSGEDINLISVLTPQIATALEKSRLYNELQDLNLHLQEKVDEATSNLKVANIDLETRNRYLTALQKISSTITRSLDFTEVISFIANSIRSELGFSAGVINFIDEESKNIYIGGMSIDDKVKKVISILPQNPSRYRVSFNSKNNLAIRSITNGSIEKSSNIYDLFVPAIDKDSADKIQKAMNVKSAISVPIYSENKIIGSIDFFSSKNIEKITKTDIEVMKSLADQTGLVIKNITLYGEISNKNLELEHANEHLKKLDEAKSEFLSIASHQLRTPLTGIKGYLSMILEGDYGKFSSKQENVLHDVYNASERMARLISVFLNVSRIESGKFKMDRSEVDLGKLVKICVNLLEINAGNKKLKLILKVEKNLPKINIDADKIKDVVSNLIENSIKYTNKGKIEINVMKNGEKELLVKIQDTGIGLEDHEIEKLFNKFSRGDDSAKINTDGSGLGLYIARRIIEAHNGKIWVESSGKGKGSLFQFSLPIV